MGSIPQYVRSRSARPGPLASERPEVLRLLVPIDATERSRWSLAYLVALQKSGVPVVADLLYVAEPVTSWQVLRFRTQAEVAAHQREFGQWQLDDAIGPLREAGIVARTHYREGESAFEILDCAEQLGCDRIVMPQPHPRWMTLLDGDVVREVLRRSGTIPVVTVDREGNAQSETAVAADHARRSA